MARTAAISGKGTTLSNNTVATGGSPVLIGEVIGVSVPEVSMGHVEATHYGSEESTEESVQTGWWSVGDVEFNINFVKTQYATLFGLKGTAKYWTVTMPDSSTWVWYAEIAKIGGDAIPNKDVIKSKLTLKHLGKIPVFTAGA